MDTFFVDGTIHGGISVVQEVAFRILGRDELREIRQKDKNLLDRSVKVISRVRFADQLRFMMPLALIPTDIADTLDGFDRDALEVYLLCTCLDTLAGRDNYVDFPDWLKTSKEVHSGVTEKEAYLREQFNSQKVFSKKLYKSILERLINIYLDNYGVRRNIHTLIRNLPEKIKQELSTSYKILKVNNTTEKWENMSVDQRLKVIFDYLLECRRNKYTHSAQTFPAFGGIRVMRRALVDGDFDLPNPDTKKINWRDSEFNVTCNYGDESFLLREILMACLAFNLGVLDEDWIPRYREAEKQRRILCALIYEINYNLKILQIHFSTLYENFVLLENALPPRFRVNIAKSILAPKGKIQFQAFIPRLDDYIKLAVDFNKRLDHEKEPSSEFLDKSEFRWLCPILRSYCENLLNDYPAWVYDQEYVYNFNI